MSSREEKRAETKQQQKMHSSSKGGGREMLRHIDGDVSMCLGKKERTTTDQQVSRHTQDEGTVVKSSSSKGKNPTSTKEDSKDVTFIVLRNAECRWDAILVSETWRPEEEEIWESKQGHIIMCAGKFENKHGVAIVVNKKWKHKINWTNNISERAIATSVTVKTQRITLVSVYMPHSGYADHHVEKAYNMIEKVIKPTRHMLIIGGDFNAELGPGIGTERRSVGQQTLNEANKRGDWMKQWLMTQKLVALNTMYRKTPTNQATFRTPKGAEKQLDYILVNRKYLRWSKDAEANNMIHMESDHRSVMAQVVIPAKKKKNPSTAIPT